MSDSTLRVVVASERPEFRQMLAGVVEREPGAVVVGQAENSLRALALARQLRPQVALVDPELPYIAGLESQRLSRMSGLDTAVNISHELPSVAAVLVSNPQPAEAAATGPGDPQLWVYGETAGARMPVRLHDLMAGTPAARRLVFGGIKLGEAVVTRVTLAEVADKLVLCGGLGIMGGLGLMVTLVLAGAGIALAAGGAATLLLGFAGKLVASARTRAARD